MNKSFKLFVSVLLILTLNSCGVISKTRYGNGLKLNLWESKAAPDANPKTLAKTESKKPTRFKLKPVEEKVSVAFLDTNTSSVVALAPQETSSSSNESLNLLEKLQKGKSKLAKIPNATVIKPRQGYPMQPVAIPMEPNVKLAAWLFYGSWVLGLFFALGEIAIPFLGILPLIGFILAIVGLSNIRRSGGAYRGSGLAISIIVLFILFLLLYLFLYLLLYIFAMI